MRLKKVIVIAAIGILSAVSFGDGISEATESLDNAKTLITDKNYSKAIEEINYALNKLNEALTEKLAGYIPEAPKGFVKDGENSKSNSAMAAMFGGQGALMASAEYIEDKAPPVASEDGESPADTRVKIKLSIASGGILGKAGALANMGQMAGGDSNSKSIRIKGYTGTATYNKADKRGTIIVQVGEKVSITAEGENIANVDQLKAVIELIKLNELEKGF